MRIKVKTDRYGLPMWLLWLRPIIFFKLSTKSIEKLEKYLAKGTCPISLQYSFDK